MKLFFRIIPIFLLAAEILYAQTDSAETTIQSAIYERPFIVTVGQFSTSVGGYVEGNTNYFSENGTSEGLTQELRRFNIFLFSSIAPGIKFLSELEFEHGTEEIALETALIDIEFAPQLVLRGGILLIPLGMFNQNHDSPKWDIIDRPLVSTQIIPATLSEVGFGIHGRTRIAPGFNLTYAGFATNGLSDGIIHNSEGHTFLPAGKSPDAFEEDNNGLPAYSGRIALRHSAGELGLSFYTGVFNTFRMEGIEVDERRSVTLGALDLSVELFGLTMKGEGVLASIDVPANGQDIFGARQWGGFIDMLYPVYQGAFLQFQNLKINAVLRAEYIDLNDGTFSTGGSIGDEVSAFTAGFTIRPTPNFVLKANYRRHWTKDLIGNAFIQTAGVQFGFATYF